MLGGAFFVAAASLVARLVMPWTLAVILGVVLWSATIVVGHLRRTDVKGRAAKGRVFGLPWIYAAGLLAIVALWIGLFFLIDGLPQRDADGEVILRERGTAYFKVRAAVTAMSVLALVGLRRLSEGGTISVGKDLRLLAIITSAMWLTGAALPVSIVLAVPIAIFLRVYVASHRFHEEAARRADKLRAQGTNHLGIAPDSRGGRRHV